MLVHAHQGGERTAPRDLRYLLPRATESNPTGSRFSCSRRAHGSARDRASFVGTSLRESRDRLSCALDAAGMVGTWDWCIPSDTAYCDAQLAALCSVDPKMGEKGAPLSTFFNAVHPEDVGRLKAAIDDAIETGEKYSQDCRIVQKDGRFSQFEVFEEEGTYAAMVKIIRQNDLKFQGSINPMVLAHGDAWESIQYSGRENPESWKCPFHFMKQKDKPL